MKWQPLFIVLSIVFCLTSSSTAFAEAGSQWNTFVLLEELEASWSDQPTPSMGWGLTSWVGGDWNRLWIKSEGGWDQNASEGELQLLYSRLIAPFWEVQVGARGDINHGADQTQYRGFFVLGLEGMVPYWFEIEPAIFVSHQGDLSARFRISYDMFITQRLITQASLELNAAIQAVPEVGIGRGLNGLATGLRMRYEFSRKFAPYLGITLDQSFFGTARLKKQAGEDPQTISGVAGLRFWF